MRFTAFLVPTVLHELYFQTSKILKIKKSVHAYVHLCVCACVCECETVCVREMCGVRVGGCVQVHEITTSTEE